MFQSFRLWNYVWQRNKCDRFLESIQSLKFEIRQLKDLSKCVIDNLKSRIYLLYYNFAVKAVQNFEKTILLKAFKKWSNYFYDIKVKESEKKCIEITSRQVCAVNDRDIEIRVAQSRIASLMTSVNNKFRMFPLVFVFTIYEYKVMCLSTNLYQTLSLLYFYCNFLGEIKAHAIKAQLPEAANAFR
jgi:hypothetical protein